MGFHIRLEVIVSHMLPVINLIILGTTVSTYAKQLGSKQNSHEELGGWQR